MTRWLSDFLVGRVIQVNVNGFPSDKISPIAGVPQGSVLSPLLFLIYVNDLPNPHHRQNSKSQFADDTALWAVSENVQFEAKLLRKDLRKLAKWCAKWRIKLNPEKTKVIIFSRSPLARKSEPVLKLYGERLKIYPQVKFLGITFDSKLTFQKHFEEILGRCNTRYHRVTFNRINPAWDHFPTPLSVIHPVSLQTNMTYRGNFSKHPIAPETGSPAYTRTRLAHSFDLELKLTQATLLVCLPWDALCVPQAVGSKIGHPSTSYIWSLSLTVGPVTNFCT